MEINEIREKLRDRNLRHVARAIGIHENSLYRLVKNEDANPSYETVRKIVNYLERHP